jgi:hypothetical protein
VTWLLVVCVTAAVAFAALLFDPANWFHDGGYHRMLNGWGIVLAAALGLAALISGIAFFAITADRTGCNTRAHGQRYGAAYDVWAGCRYRLPDGRIVPEDRFQENHLKELPR